MRQPRSAASSFRSFEADGPRVAAPVPGWRLNFVAGVVPLLAGLTVIATGWINVVRAGMPWWTGLGSLGFSYRSLEAAGPGASQWVALTGSVGGVNIAGAAIAVMIVARFGLREGRSWAWWFLAFCLGWIGVHDLAMTAYFFAATGQPFVLLPFTYCALMLAGLLRSRHAVFSR